jgi:hypothetical protein
MCKGAQTIVAPLFLPCVLAGFGFGESAEFFHQFRYDGEQVADEAVIGDAEDRRFRVLVDRDDDLAVSLAISSKRFIDIFTFAISTPLPSDFTRNFTL